MFPLGQTVATPGAIAALAKSGESALTYLVKHTRLDPGDLDPEDQDTNRKALKQGLRIFSAYVLKDGTKIWVITEADRSVTTILLPDEY